jgi:hypothetical protein
MPVYGTAQYKYITVVRSNQVFFCHFPQDRYLYRTGSSCEISPHPFFRFRQAYTALSEFCASFDYDSVVNIVESLERYRFPEDEATRFDALKKAVDNFDYELIPGILSGGEK